MPDLKIDLLKLVELLEHRGARALKRAIQQARRTIDAGNEVVVQIEYVKAPPDVQRIIRSKDELDRWRKEITPIRLKTFQCPICDKPLKRLLHPKRSWTRLKCYRPRGCGSIFRLTLGDPLGLVKCGEFGNEEGFFPAIEN